MSMYNECKFQGNLSKVPVIKEEKGVKSGYLTIRVDKGYGHDAKEKAKAENRPIADYILINIAGKTVETVEKLMAKNHLNDGKAIEIKCSYSTYTTKDENGKNKYNGKFYLNEINFPPKDFENTGDSGVPAGRTPIRTSKSSKPTEEEYYPEPDDEFIPF